MRLGEPDYAFDSDEVHLIVGRMWSLADPGLLLLNSWVSIVVRGGSEHRAETAITRLTPNRETEQLARDREFEAWLRPRLERHRGFRELNRYFAGLGIEGKYLGFGEYSGQSGGYGFIVREEHLPTLERMAQDESGFVTPEDRAASERDFRTYIARHYDENWEQNRKLLPAIDESPYGIR